MVARAESPLSLKQIQGGKGELLAQKKGSLIYNLSDGSKALGVSRRILKELFQSNQFLSVEPGPTDDTVAFRIKKICSERNLWDEVLETLKKGRSATNEQKGLYLQFFRTCKLIGEVGGERLGDLPVDEQTPEEVKELINFARAGGDPGVLDVDLRELQIMTAVVYASLPPGTQNELEEDAFSPKFILSQG